MKPTAIDNASNPLQYFIKIGVYEIAYFDFGYGNAYILKTY